MWIVKIALSRPYTFIVFALVIVLMTPLVLQRTPTDIFPEIDIPVISVAWNYSGFSPQQMEDYIVSNDERFMTTVVDNIEHIESQTVAGRSVIKVFFQPGADIRMAMSQLTRSSQTLIRQIAAWESRPAHHHLFGLDRSHCRFGTEGRRALRAGAVRLRRKFRPQSNDDHPRRGDSLAVMAASSAKSP